MAERAKKVIDAAERFDPWPSPDMSVLDIRRPPPEFPADLLGPFWAGWLADAAEGAGAPIDYVAAALLTTAAASIGNARWSSPWKSWQEPTTLWSGAIGDPSSGKSPAIDPVLTLARDLEAEWLPEHEMSIRSWEALKVAARVAAEKWEREAKDAAEIGRPPPSMPADAVTPSEPTRRRLVVSDATPEALAGVLAGNPKGCLLFRDELAGWLGNMNRYSGAGERQMWLEAYGGRSYVIDRVKHAGQPLAIERLSVCVLGGMQPDRLAEVLGDADDGLSARFLWFWPAPVPPARPNRFADVNAARIALRKLTNLILITDHEGKVLPAVVRFTDDAAVFFQSWRVTHHNGATGLTGAAASSWGKNPGHVVRLALVLEFLWWCSDLADTTEPAAVSRDAVMAAAALVDSYVKPMTARALGDSSVADEDRGAANLAKWLLAERPPRINLRQIRRTAGLAGLREAAAVAKAAAELVGAGWLRQAPVRVGGSPGRARTDFLVNPKLLGG